MKSKSPENIGDVMKNANNVEPNNYGRLLDKIKRKRSIVFASVMAIIAAAGFGCEKGCRCHADWKGEETIGCSYEKNDSNHNRQDDLY